ncbi:hypothetical protein [Thermogymnomonas acidicola]|nr:hypothetical protein [Thermogymnomonas acidicola]
MFHLQIDDLIEGIRNGDRKKIARAITLVEDPPLSPSSPGTSCPGSGPP